MTEPRRPERLVPRVDPDKPVTIKVPVVVEPVKPWAIIPTPKNVERAALAKDARALIAFFDDANERLRHILQPALIEIGQMIRAEALEFGGFGKNRGDSVAALKAKTIFITGREYDRSVTCTKSTLAGTRCKNKPLVGQEHCHVPGHATEQERARSKADSARWTAHMQLLLAEIGLQEIYNDLSTRIRSNT